MQPGEQAGTQMDEELDLECPAVLLEQLESGRFDHRLGEPRGDDNTYPHTKLLEGFGLTPEVAWRQAALQCLRLMVQKGAVFGGPAPFSGRRRGLCIESTLVKFDWSDSPELWDELGQLYLKAGLLKVDVPTPGDTPTSGLAAGRLAYTGKLPLAIAIAHDHVECAKLFIQAGASLDDIGAPQLNSPRRQALAYAREVGSLRVAAYLAALVMEREIAHASTPPAAAADAPIRRRHAL